MNLTNNLKDKSVLVTGACGTVGAELTQQVISFGASRVVCIDNNETDLFFLQEQYKSDVHVECYLADIRELDELTQRMRGIDIVLHSAALKHVGLCETSPSSAIKTNVDGVQNIIDAALENSVERVIFTSSDKAVNPTNVMGTTKLMGERLMTAASVNNKNSNTIFASTRFGNVLGSRGSVVPLFKHQLAIGNVITLTDKQMTRFVMTLEEAAALVLKSVFLATGGEVFITKMHVARIEEVAINMAEQVEAGRKVEIKEIGIKPGEKLYEELMNAEEIRRAYEIDKFLVVLPAFCANHRTEYPQFANGTPAVSEYNSSIEPALSKSELGKYLRGKGII